MERGAHQFEPSGYLVKTRPFTLRLPEDLYLQVSDLAKASGRTINATVTELTEIALSGKMDVRNALMEMFNREFPDHAITSQSDQPL